MKEATLNIHDYLGRVYSYPPCWELVTDVYIGELSIKLIHYNSTNKSTRSIAEAFRLALHKKELDFQKEQVPEDYDIVLLGASSKLGLHHCGIYYKGRILHAIDSGNLFEALSTIKDKYPLMEYWRYSK